MSRKHIALVISCVLSSIAPVHAQNQNKLIDVLRQSAPRDLFTYVGPPVTIPVDAANYDQTIRNPANYRTDSLSTFLRPLNVGIATQLSSLPIASPASAVILKEDPATGAMVPASQSLGPILTERAETIGKGRFFAGYTRQQFRFEEIDGQELGNFQTLVLGGQPSPITQPTGARQTAPVTLRTQVDLRIDQNVAFFTYGLTNRIDVSTALTWGRSSVSAITRDVNIQSATSTAGGNCWCVQSLDLQTSIEQSRLGAAGRPEIYRLADPIGARTESATGIGDTLVRVKGTVLDRQHLAVAVGADLRLPTGDEANYLGSGAIGFKPFTAVSLHTGSLFGGFNISPHFNLGYQVNGKSILASPDPTAGIKASLPNQLSYAVGAEMGVRTFTVVTDFLGQRLFDANRIVIASGQSVGATPQPLTGGTLTQEGQSFSMNSFAVGVKFKTVGNLVLTANTLFALDNNGLRDKIVPLFGLSYTIR